MSERNEMPQWVRQEACPECGGDGCNRCQALVDAPAPVQMSDKQCNCDYATCPQCGPRIARRVIEATAPATSDRKPNIHDEDCGYWANRPCDHLRGCWPVEAPAPAQPTCPTCGVNTREARYLCSDLWHSEAAQPTTVVHVPVPEGNESRYVEVLREQSQATQPTESCERCNAGLGHHTCNETGQFGPQDTQPVAELSGDPGDIRIQGWAVAVHNDYRLNGEPHTFWLFTKGREFIKGEGRTDTKALNQIRAELSALPTKDIRDERVCHCGLVESAHCIGGGAEHDFVENPPPAIDARAEAAEAERDVLAQWKREAMESLGAWDSVTEFLRTHFDVKEWGGTWQQAVLGRLAKLEAAEARNKGLEQAPRFNEKKHIERMVAAGCAIDFDPTTLDLIVTNERADSLSLLLREVGKTLAKMEWSAYSTIYKKPMCPACMSITKLGHAGCWIDGKLVSCWLSALLTRLSSDTKEGK